jgi:predicted RNA-binding Zn ribbon-like protein
MVAADPYLGVVTGFQPAGRAPAPAPLDLLQDFVNTEIPEWAQDELGSPAALSAWLAERGLLDPGAAPASADAFLQARTLRSCLRALALANTTGLPSASGAAAPLAELGPLRFELAIGEDGSPTIAPVGEGVDRALATLAAIAIASAQAGTWSRFKACRKDTCGWIFYDRSRNRSSNWCSMTICGNRSKTAGYRRRRATA